MIETIKDWKVYDELRASSLNGGVVAFDGTAWISNAISFFTKGNISHVGLVMPSKAGEELVMTESTIWDGVSGPQLNNVRDRSVGDYHGGGRSWVLEFTDEVSKSLNWTAIAALTKSMVGQGHYNKFELVCDALRHIPVVGPVLSRLGYDDDSAVCCEYVLMLLNAGGLVATLGRQMPRSYGSTPRQLCSLPIYKRCVQIYGPVGTVAGYKDADK